MPGIDEFVSNRLNITATIANPFTQLVFDETLIAEQQRPAYAMLVGLVTDPGSAATKTVEIDLNKGGRTPITTTSKDGEEVEGEPVEEVATPWFAPALAVGALCLILSLAAWATFNFLYNRTNEDLTKLNAEVDTAKHDLDKMSKTQSELGGLRQKQAVLLGIVKHGTPVSGLLQLVRETIPEGVEIYNFTATPSSFKANCAALDFARASHFAINMEGTHLFSGVDLNSPHRLATSPEIVIFDLNAAVTPEIGAKHVDQAAIESPPKPVADTAEDEQHASAGPGVPGASPIAGRSLTK